MKIFDLVPTAAFDFQGLDVLSRCTFGLIYNRFQLSYKNKSAYSDETGIYTVYERKELASELGITQPTLRRTLDILQARELLVMKRVGMGAGYRYYIPRRVWDYLRGDYADCEYLLLEPFSAADLEPLAE